MIARFPELLPITAVTAIVIFVLRELFEVQRRRHTKARQIGAYKRLLARECEVNLWSLISLARAVDEVKEDFEAGRSVEYEAINIRSEMVRFRRKRDEQVSESNLPPVRSHIVRSAALEIAKLDDDLLAMAEESLDQLLELEHLHTSFVDYVKGQDFSPVYLQGFVDWATDQFPDIRAALDNLYLACTGKKLEQPRLRG